MGRMDSTIDSGRVDIATVPRSKIRWIARKADISNGELLDFLLAYLGPRSDDPCCGHVTDRIILTLLTRAANPDIGNVGRL